MIRNLKLPIAVAAILVFFAGCSSTKPATGASSSTSFTIGVLTDITGPASSASKTSTIGVAAGDVIAAKDGYIIKFVVGDTETSPAGALLAAKKLVEQNHVQAIVSVSALTFAAARYLTSQDIPVVGFAEDGPEWLTAKNMFSTYGYVDTSKVSSTIGAFLKMEGVTVVGSIGYDISPSSAEAAKAAAMSAGDAGLKVGYLNPKLPFGSTNVEPIALAMKNAGVNGVTADVDPNTNLALLSALEQLGDTPRVGLFPTGYGSDLLQAGPGAVQSAQGAYFTLAFEPVEMNTAATRQFQSALRTTGATTEPTFSEYGGYTSVILLVQALKLAGPNPTHSAIITALSNIKSFDAAGLLGNHPINFTNRPSTAIGPGGCSYITRLPVLPSSSYKEPIPSVAARSRANQLQLRRTPAETVLWTSGCCWMAGFARGPAVSMNHRVHLGVVPESPLRHQGSRRKAAKELPNAR